MPRPDAGAPGRRALAVDDGRRLRRWSKKTNCRLPIGGRSRPACSRARNSTDPAGCFAKSGASCAGGGRLLAVVPNRRGLWARMDTTPFGHGWPYSRSQITHLLRETWFTPTGWDEALYVPPIARGWFLRSAVAWERAGSTISAPFAGVHIVEGNQTSLSGDLPARRERRRFVPVLQPVLAPSPGAAALSPIGEGHEDLRP